LTSGVGTRVAFDTSQRRSVVNYERLVDDVIEEHRQSPIDMLGIGDAAGEYTYLQYLKDSYIRTVRDVDFMYHHDRSSRHFLEIGSFLGPVSISLKRLGYRVSALDIPEFHESLALRNLYQSNGIPFSGLNLRHASLPYESNTFDLVIACAIVEHLNFNPLPVLGEINRVLRDDGHVYIGMPNQTSIVNRMKLLLGGSIHNPIDDFFKQLDRHDNMIVGLHWREYTMSEAVEMVESMGFEIVVKYYWTEEGDASGSALSKVKRYLREATYAYPAFGSSQVVVGRKVATPSYDFWLTDANS